MTLPSEGGQRPGLFDRFADRVNGQVSKAPFFACCVLLVIIWAPSYLVVGNLDTWQLLINTPTTIITFLLVALLQNTAKRGDDATQQKLNALAVFMLGDHGIKARDELREAIGLEDREAS